MIKKIRTFKSILKESATKWTNGENAHTANETMRPITQWPLC